MCEAVNRIIIGSGDGLLPVTVFQTIAFTNVASRTIAT